MRLLADQLVPPSARLILQPGGGLALVQLPTIMRAEGPRTAAKKFFVDAGAPIGVAVAVRATSWTWQVDSTAVLTTNYPGRAYQSGHSPRTEPDYYASHTFTQTGPHQLSVTVTWAATATIGGLGTVPIDGAITRTSPPVAIQVKQARAQLES